MRRIYLMAGLIVVAVSQPTAAADLESEAREILQRRCLSCHGPKTKISGLDLSGRASALQGGAKGPALKPGYPAESLLLNRVSKDEMPPAAPLPAAEKDVLRRWVESGAPWQEVIEERRAGPDWWALQPVKIRQPPSPQGIEEAWNGNVIDRWIYAKLREKELEPSPPADKRTLIRRVYFDLLGLPPNPEEIQAFLADHSPDAYERLIDRLLNSPHYGERWARHWLDVVRFAESEGFERDWLRDHAWAYRDYVIRSFNQDKPYTQFMKEQIAGDVLEPVTHEGIIATSFLTLGPFDAVGLTSAVAQERAAVREDQLEEMLGVVGQTFLGLTVNCARCHDHKFDPIPQRDYYRLKSIFEAVWQPTDGDALKADGRPLLTPAEVTARREGMEPVEKRIAALEESLGGIYRAARRKLLEDRGFPKASGVPGPVAQWTFDADARDDFGVLHAHGKETAETEGRLHPASGSEAITLATPPLPFDIREKTLEAWVYVQRLPEKPATVLRILNRSGYRGAAVDGIQYVAGKSKQWENLSTVRFRTEEVAGVPEDTAPGGRIHIAIVYAGDDTIQLYRNGQPYGRAYKPDIGLSAGRLQTYGKGDAVVELTGSPDLELEEARLYKVALTPAQIAAVFSAGVSSLTSADLMTAMDAGQERQRKQLREELDLARNELKSIPEPQKVFAATIHKPEPTHVLLRGDVNRKGDLVTPGGPSCIAALPSDFGLSSDAPESERRRKFAEWLASPDNPLPARVMVNRIWHHHFGGGLAENPNDFGYNGGHPSHPELLDWLAGEFVRQGWSVKKVHKMILTSQAYRQSARFNAKAAEFDAGNRLLWRYSPRRLEGETVRDAMLSISGKLNAAMYGPSFRNFQIVKNTGSYHSYQPVDSDDPEQQRRTIYRMNVNSGGDPMLEALDCPVPSVKTPKRSSTTTALQALSLMNNAFVERQASACAERVSREAPDVEARVERAFWLSLGRPPEPDELAQSIALANQQGMKTLCWGLLNTSEFLYVE